MPGNPGSIMDAQNHFLAAFEVALSAAEACRTSKVSYSTLQGWRKNDTQGFRTKFLAGNERRLDTLEERMFNVIEWSTREENFAQALRYPTLLMFALKAGRPMYRDSVQVATGAADLLTAISKLNDGATSPEPSDEPVSTDKPMIEQHLPLTNNQNFKMRSKLDTELHKLLATEA